MMNSIVKWGILGAAHIAEKAIIPAILQSPTAKLEAIASRNEHKLYRFQQAFHPEKTYTNYEDALQDPQIEVFYIPLPNALHKEWTIKALQAGKHVLCEKPLALNPFEVNEMFQVAKKENRFLMEAFAYIHNPLIQKFKYLISEGIVGEVRYIQSTFSFNLTERPQDVRWFKKLGGGAVYDLGCYPVHLTRFLLNAEPEAIWACSKLHPEERTDLSTSILMDFGESITASIHVSFDQPRRMTYEIQGTHGFVFTDQPFNEAGNLSYTVGNEKRKQEFSIESPNNYFLEICHFNEVIRKKAEPVISQQDSIQNAQAIFKVLEQIGY